jgi:uncharacterized short protein YbdD (DUF466 family)
LIVNFRINNTTIEEFVTELNKAIPIKSNILAFTIYKFNRNKYLANKQKFIDDIVGTSYYENMILWTDYNDILKYFNLTDKIFLGWDKYTNHYKAYPPKQIESTVSTETCVVNQDIVIIDNYNETTNDVDQSNVDQSNVDQFEEGMDDYDRLFAHMQERKKKLKKSVIYVL